MFFIEWYRITHFGKKFHFTTNMLDNITLTPDLIIQHLKKNKGKIFFWQTFCRLTLHGHIFGDICFVYKQTIILLTNNPFVDTTIILQSFCWHTIILLIYKYFVDTTNVQCWHIFWCQMFCLHFYKDYFDSNIL